MLDIVNIYKLTDGMLLEKTNIIQNEYMFLTKRGSFWGNPPRSYLGIEKFNILNGEIEEFQVIDVINENKTLTSKDSIIYIDDNIFITEITSAQNSHISTLTIYDFDNNVIDILECRTYCFDYEKNRLVLL